MRRTGDISARIVDLELEGLSVPEIAQRLGISKSSVSTLSYRVRARKGCIKFGRSTLDCLDVYATARNTTVDDIARTLIRVLSRDRLVDAILDDGITTNLDNLGKPRLRKRSRKTEATKAGMQEATSRHGIGGRVKEKNAPQPVSLPKLKFLDEGE